MTRPRGGGVPIAATLVPLLLVASSVLAADLKVTTTVDDYQANGNCTLREAVIAANTDGAVDRCPAGSGADRIILPAGTYVLSLTGPGDDAALTGDLDVTGEVTIRGAGANATFIDGGSFEWPDSDRVIQVLGFATVTISRMTVRGGNCWNGGGIFNAGTLSVVDSSIRDNITSSVDDVCRTLGALGGGGGIYNMGTLTVIRSTLSGNRAAIDTQDESGGALLNQGLAKIEKSEIRGNYGAAGGGIMNYGNLEVSDTEIGSNAARFYGAGLTNRGNADLDRSTVSDNTDGGILNEGEALTLRNSTVSGNHSVRIAGSVIDWAGTAEIVSSTIAGNRSSRAPDCPDGPPCPLPVAGVSGPARLLNTIVSNPGYGDCWEPVVSLGNNLDGDGSCGLTASGDLPNTDPRLGPLADNGGGARTHALLPGSQAIDHIPRAECAVDADQRGVPRPQPRKFSKCDIGAYEFQPEGDLVTNVDLGNPADEALHDLEGWDRINPGLLPPEIDPDRTSRYQLLHGSSSVVLGVPLPGVPHTLSFRTEDGVCDDSFDVYLENVGPVYSYQAETQSSTFFPLHEVQLDGSELTNNAVRIRFVNTATDSCGLAAVYFVRLTAHTGSPK